MAGHTHNGSDYDFALARYNANGSLDSSFDGDGKLVTDFAATDDRGFSLAVQSDGKILVAGSTSDNARTGSKYAAAASRIAPWAL